VQPKPSDKGKTTVELGPTILEAREQATEALRTQKVPAAQRDLVSDFYRNLAPDK
jgi:hypothetical protein